MFHKQVYYHPAVFSTGNSTILNTPRIPGTPSFTEPSEDAISAKGKPIQTQVPLPGPGLTSKFHRALSFRSLVPFCLRAPCQASGDTVGGPRTSHGFPASLQESCNSLAVFWCPWLDSQEPWPLSFGLRASRTQMFLPNVPREEAVTASLRIPKLLGQTLDRVRHPSHWPAKHAEGAGEVHPPHSRRQKPFAEPRSSCAARAPPPHNHPPGFLFTAVTLEMPEDADGRVGRVQKTSPFSRDLGNMPPYLGPKETRPSTPCESSDDSGGENSSKSFLRIENIYRVSLPCGFSGDGSGWSCGRNCLHTPDRCRASLPCGFSGA